MENSLTTASRRVDKRVLVFAVLGFAFVRITIACDPADSGRILPTRLNGVDSSAPGILGVPPCVGPAEVARHGSSVFRGQSPDRRWELSELCSARSLARVSRTVACAHPFSKLLQNLFRLASLRARSARTSRWNRSCRIRPRGQMVVSPLKKDPAGFYHANTLLGEPPPFEAAAVRSATPRREA